MISRGLSNTGMMMLKPAVSVVAVLAEAFDDHGFALLHDAHALGDDEDTKSAIRRSMMVPGSWL
jgi:hypothetical protein